MSAPPAAVASSPADVLAQAALARIREVLEYPPGALIAALLEYYEPGNDECGSSFLDGTETVDPDAVTPADLFAVTTLGLVVRPSAARRLLRDTPDAAMISHCLAAARLPVDATPAEAGPALLRAMAQLHGAVAIALDAGEDEQAHVLATAICARKRPELFPVLDAELRTALALPLASTPRPSWEVLHRVLRAPGVEDRLAEAFGMARDSGNGVVTDVYPLRQLHVLLGHARL